SSLLPPLAPAPPLLPSPSLFRSWPVVASSLVELARDSWTRRARRFVRSLTIPALAAAALGTAPEASAQSRTFYLDRAQLSGAPRSEEHTSELQSRENLVCRLLLE